MKIRNGFISNSSSTSFIVDYWNNSKKEFTIKEVKEITDRAVKAYNLLMNSSINKGDIMKIGIVDDKLIKEKKEHTTERELINDKWVEIPLTGEQINAIEEQKGKIVIHTKKDNSIPYVLSEMIDALLHTDRWHWG